MKRKKILFVINDFNVGGAELFVLRLGRELSRYADVYVLDLLPQQSNSAFQAKFTQVGFQVLRRFQPAKRWSYWLWKINALGHYLGIKGLYNTCLRIVSKRALINQIKKLKPEVIHSHHFSSDVFVRENLKEFCKRWVITLHGDYNETNYLRLPDKKQFVRLSQHNFSEAHAVTYVADENVKLYYLLGANREKLTKISLGYKRDSMNTTLERSSDFTFCMVARANPAKGWREAVLAFQLLLPKYPQSRLICVAPMEGVIAEMADKLKDLPNIIFTGYTETPMQYIHLADVCILPTFFEGESTPYSVIEYLAAGKPVITTDVGDIAQMITTEKGDTAGILLPLTKRKVVVAELAEAMERLIVNKQLLATLSKNAGNAFNKFDMNTCVKRYLQVYDFC